MEQEGTSSLKLGQLSTPDLNLDLTIGGQKIERLRTTQTTSTCFPSLCEHLGSTEHENFPYGEVEGREHAWVECPAFLMSYLRSIKPRGIRYFRFPRAFFYSLIVSYLTAIVSTRVGYKHRRRFLLLISPRTNTRACASART